ncbi:UNVERIFIED_CONTAM: hypothetical protein Slati_1482600 [Sesamum latifolium]|uniref:Uncharacterized protein n=1 Tax=Sesamum latifolium TaxID=2727402 RepID=A0AAW2X4Y8_9LAMI
MSKIFQRVRCAVVFSVSQGSTIHRELVRHHNFGEGDPLPLVLEGSTDLILDVLKALLKTFETGKPLWRDLLRDWWGSFLPPTHWGHRNRDNFFSFFFGGIHTEARWPIC